MDAVDFPFYCYLFSDETNESLDYVLGTNCLGQL